MVAIYLNNVRSDGYGTYGTGTLFRIYDTDEVPDGLEARVQNWANNLNQRFEIRDLREQQVKTTWISPQQEA